MLEIVKRGDKQLLKISQYVTRDNDEIKVYEPGGICGMQHLQERIAVNINKLQERAVFEKCTIDELIRIRKNINYVLKQKRKNNPSNEV